MAKVKLTAPRVAGFKCPADKAQAFLWDATAPGLALRATTSGARAYVFQSEFHGRSLRVTIGGPDAWSIPQAQEKARALQRQIDEGTDPRAVKAATIAAAVAQREATDRAALTVAEVWAAYVVDRRPQWGALHYRDHVRKAAPGGVKAARGTRGAGVTAPGPLFPLMALPLRDLDAATVDAWATREGKTRATSARLAWRLLKVFLTWCSEQPAYAPLLPDKNPAKTTKAREALGKAATKSDVLQREQLTAWFEHVRQLRNPVIGAALQVMLLTGARPGEVLTLRWADVDSQWHGLTIRDKVEGLRIIPLTPYVAHLLAGMPRRNEWVFYSQTSDAGRVTEPNNAHTRACVAAGLGGLTLHGLRRSFASLTEWLEVPSGVVAQVMGHKPSATAEKHYKVRPLELLRVHHERIEAWILEQAGVTFDATIKAGAMRIVTTA